MKIFFATWLLEPQQGKGLTKVKANTRLVSYYHTKEKKKYFKMYVKKGINK